MNREALDLGNIAPPGCIWMCRACGKKVHDKFSGADGWDESCMLNAILVDEAAESRGMLLDQFGQPIMIAAAPKP